MPYHNGTLIWLKNFSFDKKDLKNIKCTSKQENTKPKPKI